MTGKYIIGGGISGLVFQYYHPEYKIITPDIGGLFSSAYIAIIHDTPETRHFLTDLGYENVDQLSRKSYIGYYHRGWIRETLSPELNLLIIQKKMTEWNRPLNLEFRPDSLDLSTTKSVNYFKTINVDPKGVVERLSSLLDRKDVIQGKVILLDDEFITYQAKDDSVHTLRYESLVSTVPAPVFWKLYHGSSVGETETRHFPSTPITNILTDNRPSLFHDKFDSVYYDDSVPYSRITHLQDKYCYEFTGVITQQDFNRLVGNVGEVQLLSVQFGRISNVPENEPPNQKIMFLGRFAQWKYGLTLEHILKRTLETI